MKAVLDTNILIDYLNGSLKSKREIALYQKPMISIITWMEILVGSKTEKEALLIENFLNRFDTTPLSNKIAKLAVELRKQHKIKLPDAIIWATAKSNDLILVTRNTRDFPEKDPSIRIPYKL